MLIYYALLVTIMRVIDVFYVFLNFFLTEFLSNCYAMLLMAFDRHTIKIYLLTYCVRGIYGV